jgi:hypothetical protein
MRGDGPVTAAARSSGLNLKRLALIALLLAVAAPPAAAQQDGVFVDPDSPAGKEYAVPIDQACGEAAGGGESGSGEEPLFGEGIEPGSGDSANKPRGGEGAGQNGGGSGAGGVSPAKETAPETRSTSVNARWRSRPPLPMAPTACSAPVSPRPSWPAACWRALAFEGLCAPGD